MYGNLNRRLNTLVVLGTLLSCQIVIAAQTNDIKGGADLIFRGMENPVVTGGGYSQSGPKGQPKSSLRRKVDDAISLGNAARDRNPPDLQSAETAYRLAWQLNPRDPRPYIGLGNIYMDRGNYSDAAKSYRDAIRLGSMSGGDLRDLSLETSPDLDRAGLAQSYAHLAAVLIGERHLQSAERELTEAIAREPGKAKWRAWLAYCLFLQDRFTEAAAAYKVATQLQPNNENFEQLLKDMNSRAALASAQDSATTKRLEGTVWKTGSWTTNHKSTCKLLPSHNLQCTQSGDEFRSLNPTWKVQDGLLELIGPDTGSALCSGRIGATEIPLKCLVSDEETDSIWRKH